MLQAFAFEALVLIVLSLFVACIILWGGILHAAVMP